MKIPADSFSLQDHLDKVYSTSPRKFAFSARTLKDYSIWQADFRAELNRLLCLENHPPASLAVESIQSIDRGSYTEEKLSLDVGEGIQAPIYLLTPKHEPPYKPILVFHGHDPSVQYCLGNYPDEETARANLAIDNNYAKALAEAGYLVCVVEQRGFGERLTDQVVANPSAFLSSSGFLLSHARAYPARRTHLGRHVRRNLVSLAKRPRWRIGLHRSIWRRDNNPVAVRAG